MKQTSQPSSVTQAGERMLDRRRFLCAAGAAGALVLGGEWAGRAIEASRPLPPPLAADAVADLAPGAARALVAGEAEVLAVRLDAATVVAFDRRCPHLGCPVLWAAARGRFECPCHGAAFDARTGAVLAGPPRRGLTPVEVLPA